MAHRRGQEIRKTLKTGFVQESEVEAAGTARGIFQMLINMALFYVI
jgi:hypothetical protein